MTASTAVKAQFFPLIFLLRCLSFGQQDSSDLGALAPTVAAHTLYGRAASGRLDLAVPDAPALSFLAVDPTTIMRPSSFREVSVVVSRILESGGVVPQDLALELAPFSLIRGSDLSLQSYRQNAWLYRSRVSVASNSPAGGGRNLAIGLRMSLIDRSDLRVDTSLLTELYAVAERRNEVVTEAKRKFRGSPEEFEELPEATKTSVLEQMDTYVDSVLGVMSESRIIELREGARARLWNAEILDLGLAWKGFAPDSAFRGLRVSAYGLWVSWGLPLGRSASILMGGNGTLEVGDGGRLDKYLGSVGMRIYVGTNEYKGYLETSGRWSDQATPEIVIDIGGEIKVIAGLWLEGALGVSIAKDGGTSVRATWNIRFATPELSL